MSNAFFGNNLSKLEKLKLKEFENERNERICDELEDNQFRWAEEHGATQDRETGEWQV